MSKSSALVSTLPLLLLALVMQVYHLWGWLSRDGWIQYFLMLEVYLVLFITLLYLRSIIRSKDRWVKGLSLLLVPAFYLLFSSEGHSVNALANSLWYINLLISMIASAWTVVFIFGIIWSIREIFRQEVPKKTFIIYAVFIFLSAVMTYFIKLTQLPEALILKIWDADKLRTIWFMLEPVIVLSFSSLSIYFYLAKKTVDELKKEYVFIALLVLSMGFEYFINGFSLVTLRTVIYFLGLYSFINLIQNRALVNYVLISVFIILVALHLYHYSSAPHFFALREFIAFFHNALIESIKIFIAIYIFIMGWSHVKTNVLEFRMIMVFVTMIAYTYTTQSQGAGVNFYDILAITAMLKLTAAFLIIVYGFYYFREEKAHAISVQ